MQDIIIRKIIESDIESIADLYKLFWNDNQNIQKMKNKYNDLKDNNKYIFLCAAINNKVVGTIMGIMCEELYGDCMPFIVMEDLIVQNDYRKRKIGTLLLKELEKIGKESNCSQILFITERNRTETISFYEKLGYNSKTHIGFKKKL